MLKGTENNRVHVSYKVLMLLMDGKPHKLGEFVSYLLAGYDPKIAVRWYMRDKRSMTSPLKEQVRIGARGSLISSLGQMHRNGHIVYGRDEESWLESTLQLTPAGRSHIINGGKNKAIWTSISREMCRLYIGGEMAPVFCFERRSDENQQATE